MPFGKTPVPPAVVAALRAAADAQRERLAALPPAELVSALQPFVDEEIAHWERAFGHDQRIAPHATTLALEGVLGRVGRAPVDGEAVIEALVAQERLDASARQPDARFDAWSHAVTAPPPKTGRFRGAPSDHARLSAAEMYLAFSIASGCMLSDPRTRFELMGKMLPRLAAVVHLLTRRGARFEREPDEIAIEWLSKLSRLRSAYRQSGNPRAVLAFLRAQFRFELDKEKRRVGNHVLRPAHMRQLRKRAGLATDARLTEQMIEGLLASAEAAMKHAPPAGFLNLTMLGECLQDRRDDGRLARTLGASKSLPLAPSELRERLAETERGDEILSWLHEPRSSRPPLPAGALAEAVPLSEGSVRALVRAYERARAIPFKRRGRFVFIPEREVDAIVTFANSGVATRRG